MSAVQSNIIWRLSGFIFKEADMRTTLLAVTLIALSFIYCPATASAQDERVARGTVSEIGSTFITVKVGSEAMRFSADTKTRVENRGAGTKARQAMANGKSGPRLSDVLKVGQGVAVTYRDLAGKPYASFIRAIPSVGNGGSVQAAPEMRSTGTVKAIAGDSITIVGAVNGGGSFTQTFVVNSATKVVGRGAGTATAAKGGRAPFTDLIAAGDRVSISYHNVGNTLQASDIRVTMKGSGSH
jgi:uncharacterized protein DUF5666